MPTTLPQSTLHSGDNHFSSRIFIGVGVIVGGIALGGIMAGGEHYGSERNCRVELCAPTDNLWLPDEPAQNDPVGPLANPKIKTIGATSITPTNAPAILTAR